MFLCASVVATPPFQMYLFALFDIVNATLFGVSYIKFTFNISPKVYFGTVTTFMGAMQFSLGMIEV